MSKKQSIPLPVLFVSILLVILIGIKFVIKFTTPAPQNAATSENIPFDFGNQKITLNGQPVIFVNGSYETSDPTRGEHIANMTNKSVNSSQTRAATILIDSPEGSGTFYYIVGAMLTNETETYSLPVLLGDRIEIASVNVDEPGTEDNGEITVEYLDRTASASMSTEPTIKTTKKFAFQDDGNLIEVLH